MPAEPLKTFDTEEGFRQHREWEATLNGGRWGMVTWPEELVQAVRAAYLGQVQLHPDIARTLMLAVAAREESPASQPAAAFGRMTATATATMTAFATCWTIFVSVSTGGYHCA